MAALILVEEHRLRLEDPIDALAPELADRRVLVDGSGPLDGETVPAVRSITLHDVLTFRTGLGMDFDAPFPQPLLEAMAELEINTAPPAPQLPPEPDEWMRRLGTLPLLHQPGARWLYHHSADLLGVLVARASGQALEVGDVPRIGITSGHLHPASHEQLGERAHAGTGDADKVNWARIAGLEERHGGRVNIASARSASQV